MKALKWGDRDGAMPLLIQRKPPMTRKKITLLGSSALVALGLLGGVATTALAEQSSNGPEMSEGRDFLAAKGSLSAAIAAAEGKTGGKAIDASYENGKAAHYEVGIVMPDGTMQNAKVDPSDDSVTVSADAMDDEQNGTETNESESDQGTEGSESNGND